ncbi:hypothetical protein RSAG8_11600, partial [Rhizoctonia solani AG-8 WAC10335]
MPRKQFGKLTRPQSQQPSKVIFQRKRTEPDEDGPNCTPSRSWVTLPTAPPIRDTSPEPPSTLRNASPAPTEILSSPIPVPQAENQELARNKSESCKVEAEIAKFEVNSHDAKKGKPGNKPSSDEPPPPKDKAPLKPPQGKKGTHRDDAVEEVEKEVSCRKHRTPHKAHKPGEADLEDLFALIRNAKKELVESINVGGPKRKTRN